MSEQVETIVIPKTTVKPKRQFGGFDADLAVDLAELSLRVPVKYCKIDSKAVREKLKIVHRASEANGVVHEVENKPSPYRGTVRLDVDPQVKGNREPDTALTVKPNALILA